MKKIIALLGILIVVLFVSCQNNAGSEPEVISEEDPYCRFLFYANVEFASVYDEWKGLNIKNYSFTVEYDFPSAPSILAKISVKDGKLEKKDFVWGDQENYGKTVDLAKLKIEDSSSYNEIMYGEFFGQRNTMDEIYEYIKSLDDEETLRKKKIIRYNLFIDYKYETETVYDSSISTTYPTLVCTNVYPETIEISLLKDSDVEGPLSFTTTQPVYKITDFQIQK